MKILRFTLLFGLTLLLILPAPAQEVAVPRLTQYATDQTGTLSPDQLGVLNARLRTFEDSTSTQVVVLMMPTLAGEPIEEFALRVAEENRIGRGGRDNGALLLVAKEDRDVRIEVGYGLEGVLTDALSGIIIRNEIVPRFRRNDYFGGLSGAVEAIILATAGEYTAEPRQEKKKKSPFGLIPLIFIIMIIFSIFRRLFGRRGVGGGRHYTGWGIPPIGGGFGGRGGFGGGGFGGGGFSGGGGSFGGGGASGSW
jgi:uncharacterized protein